jgi:hypothetical protein
MNEDLQRACVPCRENFASNVEVVPKVNYSNKQLKYQIRILRLSRYKAS